MRQFATRLSLPLTFVFAMAVTPAFAAGVEGGYSGQYNAEDTGNKVTDRGNTESLLGEAAETAEQMKADEELNGLLQKAKGVFIIPDHARAAAIVGARGGQGVMLARDGNRWSDPVFYNTGSLSFGAQAGASAGQVAMLLMTDKAVESFEQENNFSINADAGLTLVNWSEDAQASYGKGDVIVWSDTEGALANASVSVSDISADDEANRQYYDSGVVQPSDVLNGDVKTSKENRVAKVLP